MSTFSNYQTRLKALFYMVLFVLSFTLIAQAQNYYVLSSQPNADSSEFFYQEGATLYMTVYSQTVDFNNMDKMKWEIEKEMHNDHGMMGDMGSHFEGTFQNNYDGSFSASFDLSQLTMAGQWKWKAKLEDHNKNKTEFQAMFTYMSQEGDSGHQYLEMKGHITRINGDTVFVDQYAFIVDSSTVIEGHEHQMMQFADLNVDDYVEVEGTGLGGNVYLAHKIHLEDHHGYDDHDQEMEVKGKIESISDSIIIVNGMEIKITAQTMIMDHNKMTIGLDQLTVGLFVEVKVQLMNGEKVALKIKIEDSNDSDNIEIKGVIDSLAATYLVIDNQTIYFTSNTVVKTGHHMMGSIDDLQVGQLVEVKAVADSAGDLWAVKIEIESIYEPFKKMTLKGTIDSLGTDYLMVSGKMVTVNDSTEIYGHHHTRLSFNDLQKGQVVKIKALLQDDGSLLALTIKVKELWSKYVELEGTIESLDANGLTVQGIYFQVDSNTVFFGHDHQMLTFADLNIGDFVEVKARRLSDGSYLALKVQLEDAYKMHLRVTGEIQNITMDSVRVNNMNFSIDSLTTVYNMQDSLVSFTDLAIGQIVEIEAEINADGTYHALKIEIDYDPNMVSISSSLSGKTESSVIVLGTEYNVTPNTVILDSSFNQIDYQSLAPGNNVTVWAVSGTNGYEAVQIQSGSAGSVTALESQVQIIKTFELKQNYPNPFNPTTTIEFSLNHNGFEHVSLTVYNLLGKKVKTLYSGVLDKGNYRFEWNGTNQANQPVASGLYFYRLQVKNQASVRQMILIK